MMSMILALGAVTAPLTSAEQSAAYAVQSVCIPKIFQGRAPDYDRLAVRPAAPIGGNPAYAVDGPGVVTTSGDANFCGVRAEQGDSASLRAAALAAIADAGAVAAPFASRSMAITAVRCARRASACAWPGAWQGCC